MKPDFGSRQKKLSGLMSSKNIDAIITSDINDVLYYTGYAGLKDDRIFMLFPAGGKPKLLVSLLENDAALKYPHVGYMKETNDFISQLRRFKTIGYDERSLSLLLFHEMKKKLKAKLEPVSKIMEAPRVLKDEYEIEQMKQAIKLTGKALQRVCGFLWGNSEKRIADAIEIEYRKTGVSEAFESIVCTGKQAAYIHHRPDQAVAKAGMPMLIDTGCRVNGYCSDITRMFFSRLGPKQKKIYGDIREIHDELIAGARAGVTYKELEELQKRMFARKGYRVMHGLGHGLGLSVHESCGEMLAENTVMTIEPGVYIKGFGGFRLEDVILIKKKRTEILSKDIPIL
jgi:Xaa-Pro aminopeptidase